MGQLTEFKNKYEGSQCLIFGNGPSLTPEILRKIKDLGIFSFAANGFCLIFDQVDFIPDAVCMSNYDAIKRFASEYPDKSIKFFKKGWHKHVHLPFKNVYELPFKCEHDAGKHKNKFIKDGYFTLDPGKENYCGDTVLLDFAIPLAFYMGFREIYLAGVDCDYSKGYFSKKYDIAAKKDFKGMVNNDYSIAIPSYQYTHRFLSGHGCKLYKITESARLDFIETRFPTQTLGVKST